MSNFILIDLATQHAAVKHHLQGRSREHILVWLCQFGEIHRIISPYDHNLYGFCSFVGIRTGFRLTTNGDITILGDHTTII